jgi:glycosyltransferase involved in cell wall biosynthesis
MHDFPESKLTFFEIFLNRMHWILIHNKWKLNEVSVKFPEVNKNKFIFEPNAVNIRDFDLNITTSEARKKVGLPQDKKIALYTGHLYTWKGVDTLAQAAELLKEDHLVVFVGGTVQDVADFTKKYGQSKKIP